MGSMAGIIAAPSIVSAAAWDNGVLQDFGAWMTSEQRRVYALCQRLLQDRDEADSATQDVFLKAYQALSKQNAPEIDDPARWLTRIAVNACMDRLRSRKWQLWRRRPSPEEEQAILLRTRSTSPEAEQKYFADQVSRRLRVSLGRLSGRQRAVFTLRHYEGMSLEEIGSHLDLDVGTVKVHMFRAVAKLREELRDLYEGNK
jgi:RNA polymerase sigma-70 factor (ECF subfamily)